MSLAEELYSLLGAPEQAAKHAAAPTRTAPSGDSFRGRGARRATRRARSQSTLPASQRSRSIGSQRAISPTNALGGANGDPLMARRNFAHTNIKIFRGEGSSRGIRLTGPSGFRKPLEGEGMVRTGSVQSLIQDPKPIRSDNKLIMGYKRLQNLCSYTALDIVTILINPHHGFSELLRSPLRPDLLILVMKVLSKAINCEFDANTTALLSLVCQNSSKLLESIQSYLSGMAADEDKNRIQNAGSFISDLLNFFEVVMKKLPNTASEKLKKIFIATDMTIVGIERYQNLELKEQRDLFDRLLSQLNIMIEERNMLPQKTDSRKECLQHLRPPDDFREKSVFPVIEDLFGGQRAFVRPNIIEGAFSGVEDYLDIQFRLLREDFMAPLREGIASYIALDNKKKRRIDNVRIYRDVLFGDPHVINDNVGVTLIFDPNKKMKIKWEFSKRLMYGSLILFTNDNFKSVLIGTVLNRDMKQLVEGRIIVHMEKYDEEVDLYGGNFLMVESEVYFEPYKHVMTALQTLDEDRFPMKRYIVSVENNARPPYYLLSEPESAYGVDDFNFQPLNDPSWPSNSDLHLDESQYAAFKAALTEEFVVIQGPPGTGKTYLGLKIAKALLHNARIWNANNTPILVVCYTNHALDQFLEGLVGTTEELIRVGGQSKSKTLEKYNLKEKRKFHEFRGIHSGLKRDCFHKMSELMQGIKRILAYLEALEKKHGVVSPDVFIEHNILPEHHVESFKEWGDGGFVEWLWEKLADLNLHVVQVNRAPPPEVDGGGGGGETFEERPRAMDTEDFDHEDFSFLDTKFDLQFAIDLNRLEEAKISLEGILTKFRNGQTSPDCQNEADFYKLERQHRGLIYDNNYWVNCLRMDFSAPIGEVHRLERTRNLWHLSFQEKWTLYMHWVNGLKVALRDKCRKLQRQYRRTAKLYTESKDICDLEILQNAMVVGMTTTNAARLHSSLQTLKPKIVIVEEAAEVLESHIVISIARETQHVILIGDHQQLRPSPAVYRLACEFHLNVSLFERMVKNGLACYCLDTQHRMRPEIAALIVPAIYPQLNNHSSVQALPSVKGVAKPLFFVCHNEFEEEVEDISSHKNAHEADFLLALCRHLLWQGYSPKDITVLSTYKGQLFYMKMKQRQNDFLNGVNLNVVDNYQGEENKIILLSLVRSNQENKIGFLKEENRVCVALSRAKEGMYIIGNMDALSSSSTIWPQVKVALEGQGALGKSLALRCQVHPDQVTSVASADDFTKVPEGGCLLPCAALLRCGHVCESVCHINDREHLQLKCHKPCDRIPVECSLEHPCPKECWRDCGQCEVMVHRTLPCGHEKLLACHINYKTFKCRETVDAELPTCKHVVQKPCYRDAATFSCPRPCPDRLPCGHTCMRTCHADDDPDHVEYMCEKKCAKKNMGCTNEHDCVKLCHEECGLCAVRVEKTLPACGHVLKVECSVDASSVLCKKDCKRTMSCGHPCHRKCFEACGGCQEKVKKIIPSCGHEIPCICCEPPNPEKCRKPCERKLPCGHPCNNNCGQPCTKKCMEKVKCQITIPCGHSIEIPCYLQKSGGASGDVDSYEETLLSFCQEPCTQELQCGHACAGSCGKCLQGRLHVPCAQECGRTLVCTHKCRVACASSCPPCRARCMNRCSHSICPKPCGVPCDPCTERCGRGCRHGRCSRRCFELCDITPCEEPCPRRLRCRHPCVGFCGEPCPPLCRECNAEELKEIFFGREDEEDARFVYLVDCKHTLEAEGLETWLQNSGDGISLKTCPRCKSYILCTQRYINYVKQAFHDVALVKNKVYGEMNRLKFERDKLLNKLQQQEKRSYVLQHSKVYRELYEKCRKDLCSTYSSKKGQRRNYISNVTVQSLNSEVEIINDLISSVSLCFPKDGTDFPLEAKIKIFNKLNFILAKVEERHKQISKQETSDLNQECKRFLYVAQLAVLESSGNFRMLCASDTAFAASFKSALALVQSFRPFGGEDDARAKAAVAQLAQRVGRTGLTDRERREIVQAMSVHLGAWYKCPNGHVYCIGDCGGATVESRCPECKEAIGGTQHRLLSTNRVATEMDGATRPAWPLGPGYM